ncbi:MAG TPA: hypothetical protein VIK52_01145, partial [Opitutaceae bacterium]
MDATIHSTQTTTADAATRPATAEPQSLSQRITAQLEQTMAAPGRAGKIWIGFLLAVIAAAAV